jgi:hypothetical protein
MNDAELLRFGQAAKYMCSPEANLGHPPRQPFVINFRKPERSGSAVTPNCRSATQSDGGFNDKILGQSATCWCSLAGGRDHGRFLLVWRNLSYKPSLAISCLELHRSPPNHRKRFPWSIQKAAVRCLFHYVDGCPRDPRCAAHAVGTNGVLDSSHRAGIISWLHDLTVAVWGLARTKAMTRETLTIHSERVSTRK